MMAQMNRAQEQYRGCLGSRDGTIAERLVTRRANWGPRAVWNRVLARLGSYWQWVLVILVLVGLTWWGNQALNAPGEAALEEVIEPESVAAEEICKARYWIPCQKSLSSPEDQMMAALYRSEEPEMRWLVITTYTVQISRFSSRRSEWLRRWRRNYRMITAEALASLLPSVLSTPECIRFPHQSRWDKPSWRAVGDDPDCPPTTTTCLESKRALLRNGWRYPLWNTLVRVFL